MDQEAPALEKRLHTTLTELCQNIGPRPPGSFAELRAAQYLKQRFERAGLATRLETFEGAAHRAAKATLKAGGTDIPCLPQQFSAAGQVRGPLVFLGECDKPLRDSSDIRGQIGLLIPSGSHEARLARLSELEQRGLTAVVAATSHLDEIGTKELRYSEIKRLPVVGVSWRNGCRLRRLAGQTAEVTVVCAGPERQESQNVVAIVPGQTDAWMVVTAHYDTAAFAPGAYDNASGTAVLLELAGRLAQSAPAASIYLVADGSEEYSLPNGVCAGKHAFCAQREKDLEHCAGHIDIDAIGGVLGEMRVELGGNKAFVDCIAGADDALRARYVPWAAEYGAFARRGVPCAWFTDWYGSDRCFHTPADTMEFIDIPRLAGYVPAIEAAVRRLSAAHAPFFRFIRAGRRLIRPARYSDIPAIREVTRLSFGPVATARMRQEFFGELLAGKEWHVHKNEEVERFVRRHIFQTVACECEGQVVGYATYSFNPEQVLAEIGNNAVHPDWHGQAIGQLLQHEVQQRFLDEGYTRSQVTALSSNPAALRIYEKLGYKPYAQSIHCLRASRKE